MAFSFSSEQAGTLLRSLHLTHLTDDPLVLIGVRGARPVNPGVEAATIELDASASYDHLNQRCSIIQFDPQKGKLTPYLASTVTSLKYMKAYLNGGERCNLLAPGAYRYAKGIHKAGQPSMHDAFRPQDRLLVYRTLDDLIFEPTTDKFEADYIPDNIHAAFGTSSFDSAGCQVVQGSKNAGPWAKFRSIAYAQIGQQGLYYVLLPAVTLKGHLQEPDVPRVMIGSRGERVLSVKKALKSKGLYGGTIDQQFDTNAGRALLTFQRSQPQVIADAICGPQTAALLGV